MKYEEHNLLHEFNFESRLPGETTLVSPTSKFTAMPVTSAPCAPSAIVKLTEKSVTYLKSENGQADFIGKLALRRLKPRLPIPHF